MTTKRKPDSDYGATGDETDALRAATADLRLLKAEIKAGDRMWIEDFERDVAFAAAAAIYNVRNVLPAKAMHHVELFAATAPDRDAKITEIAAATFTEALQPLRELLTQMEEPFSAKRS